MSACDLRTTGEANNDAIKAFKKAYLLSGGDIDSSLRFAISETHAKYPKLDFDHSTLTDPIISLMKESGAIPKSYSFGKKATKSDQKEAAKAVKEQEKKINKENNTISKKIERATERLFNLTENQRKDLAREMINDFHENGMLDDQRVRDLYAKVLGIPHMDAGVNALIDKISATNKEVDAAEKAIRDAAVEVNEGLDSITIEQVQELAKKRQEAHDKAIENAVNLAKMMKKKGFLISDFADGIALNLMSFSSLVKNATGVGPDAMIRHMKGFASATVNLIMRPFTKANTNPFASRAVSGGKKLREAFRDAKNAAKYKTRNHEAVPQQDNMNVANEIKRAMDAHGVKKMTYAIAAAMKISPDFVSRALLATDAIPKSLAYNGELGRIADSKGLTGAQKELFMLNPDEDSHALAFEYALDVTFESDIVIRGKKVNLNYDHRAAAEKLIAEKGWAPMSAYTLTSINKIGQSLIVPFFKVPTNIIKKAATLATPEITMAMTMVKVIANRNKSWDVKQKIIADGIGSAAVGYYVRSVAIQMIAAGLMSAGYNDDEKEVKDNTERVIGGTNFINVSALLRVMLGMEAKKKNGDLEIPMTYLGAFGLTMGAYSTAFNSLSKKDMDKYNEDFGSRIHPETTPKAIIGVAKAALDNPFMTAQNNIVQAVMDKEGNKASKFAITAISSIVGGVLPATYQKISMASTPEVVSRYDKEKEFYDNLTTELGYKFSFSSKDVKKKYFSLASKGDEAGKMKKTMFFDDNFGRALYAVFGIDAHLAKIGTPDHKLYLAEKEVPMEQRGGLFPKAIAPEMKVFVNKKAVKVKLTDEQFEYLQESASIMRMTIATPYIMSKDWDESNYSTRVTKLKELYDAGLNSAIEATKKKFPGIKKQDLVEKTTGVDKDEVDQKVLNKEYK